MLRKTSLVGFTAAALVLTACTPNERASTATTTTQAPPAPSTSSSSPVEPSAGSGDPGAGGVTTAADVFGPACSQLPQGGAAGGLTAMASQPVATAASTNPLLTKLGAAVGAIPGLADTLNNTDNLTVFAPADSAFAALGDAQFAQLAANPSALSPILTHHVVGKRYDADGLAAAKTVMSVNTSAPALTIEGTTDTLTVNGAKILCGNIPTKNATVFIIDKVLLPTP